MDTAAVLRRLFAALERPAYNVQKDRILAVLLWGSRLWGTATKNSDYDLVVYHDAPTDVSLGASLAGGIDVRLVSVRSAEPARDVASVLPLLLPRDAVLFEAERWADMRARLVAAVREGRPSELVGKLIDETIPKNEAKVAKLLAHGDEAKARKIVVHVCRLISAARLAKAALAGTQAVVPLTELLAVQEGAAEFEAEHLDSGADAHSRAFAWLRRQAGDIARE